MYYFSPILDDGGAIESDLFAILSKVLYRDEEIIKVSEEEDADYQWKDVCARESNANFFRCFPNCCAVMTA